MLLRYLLPKIAASATVSSFLHFFFFYFNPVLCCMKWLLIGFQFLLLQLLYDFFSSWFVLFILLWVGTRACEWDNNTLSSLWLFFSWHVLLLYFFFFAIWLLAISYSSLLILHLDLFQPFFSVSSFLMLSLFQLLARLIKWISKWVDELTKNH